MKYTNIFEKLNCVFNIVKDNWIYLAFLGFVALLLLLTSFKKIKRKTCFMTSLISYIALLTYIIVTNNKQLGIIGNSLIDNLFMSIYFPSAYAYLFVLIISLIITFTSVLNRKRSKVYQWIHGIFFFAMQFIFVLILQILSKNKIDIFSKTSLFSNKDIIMLLEFSMNIFILWIIVLLFVYFTNIITEHVTLSEIRKEKEEPAYSPVDINTLTADIDIADSIEPAVASTPVTAPMNEVTTPVVNVPVIENSETTVQNIIEQPIITSQPVIEPTVQETYVEEQNKAINMTDFIPTKPELIIPEPVITNENRNYVSEVEEVKEDETSNYTLNDYRLFNQMLMDIKKHNQNNTITIDKKLEYRLITKYSFETYDMFKKMLKIYSH